MIRKLKVWYKRRNCNHDYVLVQSCVHGLNETEYIQYNWCLNCNDVIFLNKSIKPRE